MNDCSLDLVLNEELELLHPLRILKPQLVLLQTITKEPLDLFLQEQRLSLRPIHLRTASIDLLQQLALQVVNDHDVIIRHVHY